MKLIISLLLFVSFNKCYGQICPMSDLDKFKGNWQYINNSDTFKLQLVEYNDNQYNVVVNTLVGGHRYVKSGVKVADLIPGNILLYSQNYPSQISCMITKCLNTTKIEGMIKDLTRKKMVTIVIESLSASTLKISFKERQGVKIGVIPGPIDLPSGIVLTKQ